MRPYEFEVLKPGKPLRFYNAYSDELSSPNQERIEDILYDGENFGVRDRVRELIEPFDIAHLHFYSIMFVDATGREHTDYWYMQLIEDSPFLDRRASKLMKGSDTGPDDDLDVLRYAFNGKAMAKVPEESRLVFRVAGASNSNLFVHDRILGLLSQAKVTGYRAYRVSDFREGMQCKE